MRFRNRFVVVPALLAAAFGVLAGCGGLPNGGEPGKGGGWPNVCCRTAGDMLNEIESLAVAARPGSTPEVNAVLDRVLLDVQKCRTNSPPCPAPDGEHCRYIETALTSAKIGAWLQCANELEHGH